MHLKDVLGQIQPYRGNLHVGRLLSIVTVNTTTLWHFDAGEQGPSTPSDSFDRLSVGLGPAIAVDGGLGLA
jgi:hypothetical protein